MVEMVRIRRLVVVWDFLEILVDGGRERRVGTRFRWATACWF
jgi:hypothetical protein